MLEILTNLEAFFSRIPQQAPDTLPMKKSILPLFLLSLVLGCGNPTSSTQTAPESQSTPETLHTSGYDEAEMDGAIARARNEVDAFIAELSMPTGTDHAVKAPIHDSGETEHFWLSDITFKNGEFSGTINNDPGLVSNVKLGQKWTLKKTEISDWLYMKDGKMHGNYTLRPLLKTMPAEQAEALQAILAN